jgi:hypothetical protein
MQPLMQWLVGETTVFDLPVQNWMLVLGGILAIFVLVVWQDHRKAN